MSFSQILFEYGAFTIILLAITAFVAGFIDAVVGGGGLIQLPFLLINFSKIPLPILFGTNKIAALSGTSISAFKYSQKIKFNFKILLVISSFCFVSSFAGAQIINYINTNTLKPGILIVLIVVAVYTFIKKDLGSIQTRELSTQKQMLYGSLIGIIVGFYDGFFGPGTGSFFVLGFVVILGFDFVKASAYAKVVNCITNMSALIVFIKHDHYIFNIALIMAVFNMAGSFVGSSMAIKHGNGFVRIIFLIIVSIMIFKFGFDTFQTTFN